MSDQPNPSSSKELCLSRWMDDSATEEHVCRRHDAQHRGWHVCMCGATYLEASDNSSIEDVEPSTLSKVFGDDGAEA